MRRSFFSLKVPKFLYSYKFLITLFIFLVSVIIFSANLSDSSLTAQAETQKNDTDSSESFYLQAINNLRASKKLKPLAIDSRLSSSALSKANNMVTENYFGHYSITGKSFSEYIWQSSPNAEKVGENLAKCYSTDQLAFEALVASPTHYTVMTASFTNFGVAEVENAKTGCTYTVMHFSQYN